MIRHCRLVLKVTMFSCIVFSGCCSNTLFSQENYDFNDLMEVLRNHGTKISPALEKKLKTAWENEASQAEVRERIRSLLNMSAIQQLLNNEDIVGINSRITQLLEADADVEEIEEESGRWAIQKVSGLTLPEKGNKKGEGKPMDVFRRVLDVQATYQLMGGEDPSPELQSALKRIVNDRIGDKGKALEVAEVAYQALFDDMGYIPAMSGERMRDRLTRIAEIQQNGGSVFVQDTESNKNNSPNEVKATQEPGTGQGGTLNGQGERFSDTGLNKRQDREVWHGRYESPVGSSDPYHGREGTVYVNDSSGSFYVMFDDGTYRNVFAIESTDGKYRCENSNGSTRNDQSNTESENTENTGGGGTVVGSNDDDDDDDDDDEGGEDGNESADTSATEPGNDEESNKEEDTEKEGTGTPDPEKNQGKRSSVFEKTEGRMGGQDHRNQEKVLEHQRSGKGTIDPNPDGGQTPGGVFKIEASAKEVEAKLLLIASKGTNSTPTFERGSSYGHTVEELKAIIVILGAAGAPTKPIVNPSTNPNSPVTGKQPPNGPAPKGETLMQKESNGDDPEPGEGESPSNKPGAQGTNSPTNILNPPTPAPSAPVNKNLKDASKGSKNLKKTSVLKKK